MLSTIERYSRRSSMTAVDRLFHHAHLVTTDGPSVRLQEALAGRGVVALDGSTA